MNMCTNFLPSLGGTKNSYYWNSRFLVELRSFDIGSQLRVELGRSRLIMINTIQANAK
jgi:hypothetical protein